MAETLRATTETISTTSVTPPPTYTGPERRWSDWSADLAIRKPFSAALTWKPTEVARIFCRLRRDQAAVIEVARGTQLQVAYGDEPGSKPPEPSFIALHTDFGGYRGEVKSGSEGVLVRTDGVVLIDARVTIAFATDVLMDMTMKATIDLKDTFKLDNGKAAYRAYKDGNVTPVHKEDGRFFHRISGSLRFEGGSGSVDGDYADHFSKSSAKFDDKLELLVRQQFSFVGKVFIMKTPHYDPTDIKLVILSWEA